MSSSHHVCVLYIHVMKNTGPHRKIGFRDNCTVTVEQTHCIVCFAPFPSMHTHAWKNMGPAETVLFSKLISLARGILGECTQISSKQNLQHGTSDNCAVEQTHRQLSLPWAFLACSRGVWGEYLVILLEHICI